MKLSLLPIFGYTPKWASRQPADKEFYFLRRGTWPPSAALCISAWPAITSGLKSGKCGTSRTSGSFAAALPTMPR